MQLQCLIKHCARLCNIVTLQTLAILLLVTLSGCSANRERIQTEFISNTCIKPLIDYHYKTCNQIDFEINKEHFYIPADFDTDLASIPKIAWPIMAPAHSSLIRPAIVHDWFYRKTCDFTRYETDLIFYHMMRNEGVSKIKASIMYYAVRIFGSNYYNEDYCDEEFEGTTQQSRGMQLAEVLQNRKEGQI